MKYDEMNGNTKKSKPIRGHQKKYEEIIGKQYI